jgi:hypothetical protein
MNRRRNKKCLWLFLGGAGICSAAALWHLQSEDYVRALPFVPPRSWDHGTLLIRRNSSEGKDLLFRHLDSSELSDYRDSLLSPAAERNKPIVKFRADQHDIMVVESSEWDGADGPTVACWIQPATEGMHLKMRKYKLEYDGASIKTAGKSVLQRAVMADEKLIATKGAYLAVLSASGSPREPLIPFLGGDSVAGTRYHEVFRRDRGTGDTRRRLYEQQHN